MPGLLTERNIGAGDGEEDNLEQESSSTSPGCDTADDAAIREVLDTELEDSGPCRHSPFVEIGNKKVRRVGITEDQ